MPPKQTGPAFYAVQRGFTPGVYLTWPECENQTKGFNNAKFKKFTTRQQAEDFVRGIETKTVTVIPTRTGPVPEESASTSAPTGTNLGTAGRTPKSKQSTVQKDGSLVLAQDEPESEWSVVYTDGACKGNGQAGSFAGVGIWWGDNDPRNIAERCPGDQTNNRAELIAILRALETTQDTSKPLLIKTDSRYSIDCFDKWIKNWKQKGWTNAQKQPVKNAGIIRLIDAHLERRHRLGQKVRFKYVKGHSGDRGNDGADYQANLGATLPPVKERDWAADEELLEQLEAMEGADDLGVEVDAPAPVSASRKRSRSPPPRASSSKHTSTSAGIGTTAQPPKTPSRSSAARMAAIELALSTPFDDAGPPNKKRGLTPPRDLDHHTPSRPANQAGPERATTSYTPTKPSRPADSEASPLKARSTQSKEHVRLTDATRAGAFNTHSSAETKEATERYPVRVIYALPPLVPVKKEDINFEDYADCLLSDDELANEI